MEVKENTKEDMEHCESREEDEDLEEVGKKSLRSVAAMCIYLTFLG